MSKKIKGRRDSDIRPKRRSDLPPRPKKGVNMEDALAKTSKWYVEYHSIVDVRWKCWEKEN